MRGGVFLGVHREYFVHERIGGHIGGGIQERAGRDDNQVFRLIRHAEGVRVDREVFRPYGELDAGIAAAEVEVVQDLRFVLDIPEGFQPEHQRVDKRPLLRGNERGSENLKVLCEHLRQVLVLELHGDRVAMGADRPLAFRARHAEGIMHRRGGEGTEARHLSGVVLGKAHPELLAEGFHCLELFSLVCVHGFLLYA